MTYFEDTTRSSGQRKQIIEVVSFMKAVRPEISDGANPMKSLETEH